VYWSPLLKGLQARNNGPVLEPKAVDPFHLTEFDLDELDASNVRHPCPGGQMRVVLDFLQLTVVCTPQEISVKKVLEDAVSAALLA
jgi:hypothetical protein